MESGDITVVWVKDVKEVEAANSPTSKILLEISVKNKAFVSSDLGAGEKNVCSGIISEAKKDSNHVIEEVSE